jgi:cysteine sulfinate desulfinase/cysteine desulfurase-like protein
VINPTHCALGLTEQQSANTLLLSLGWTTSEDELQRALHLIAAAYESLAN